MTAKISPPTIIKFLLGHFQYQLLKKDYYETGDALTIALSIHKSAQPHHSPACLHPRKGPARMQRVIPIELRSGRHELQWIAAKPWDLPCISSEVSSELNLQRPAREARCRDARPAACATRHAAASAARATSMHKSSSTNQSQVEYTTIEILIEAGITA